MTEFFIRRILRAAKPTPPVAAPATGLYCNFLWDSITVLSDGKVTCGFDDPFGTRSFGNIRQSTVRDIFNSEGVRRLRAKLLSGSRCETCHLYSKVASLGEQALPAIPEMPQRLIVESTIRCNLRCRNTSCDLNNDRSFKVREESFLDFELFTRLMDEAGPHLGALYFFNYGEPFLHPRAVDMLAYAKGVKPDLHIATSTNGILLARGDAPRRIVEEGLVHWMNFTIAGYDDASYQKYHKGGSFEQAFEGMRRVIEEKRRLGRHSPTVRWRYLLFNWNDSDEQIARARQLAREVGVDEFTFFLCSAPLEGRTRRRAPGTPGFQAIADAVEYEVHYQADPFADSGLYAPEHDDALGAYCWTSRRATLQLVARGGQATLALCRTGGPAQGDSPVRIRTPWDTREARVGTGEWALNTLEVPSHAHGEPFFAEVEVDEVHIPFRHGIRDDTRELGVMVSLSYADVEAMRESDPVVASGFSGASRDPLPFRNSSLVLYDPREFVRQQFRDFFDREGDPGHVDALTRALRKGGVPAAAVESLLFSTQFAQEIAPVIRLHLACFHRTPDLGLMAWIRRHQQGLSLEAMAKAFAGLGEFVVRYGALSDEAFRDRLHRDLLGRPAPATDRANPAAPRWKSVLDLAQSAEHESRTRHRVFTWMAYAGLVRRKPDVGGYTFWVDHLEEGGAHRNLVSALLDSAEYKRRFQAIAPSD